MTHSIDPAMQALVDEWQRVRQDDTERARQALPNPEMNPESYPEAEITPMPITPPGPGRSPPPAPNGRPSRSKVYELLDRLNQYDPEEDEA